MRVALKDVLCRCTGGLLLLGVACLPASAVAQDATAAAEALFNSGLADMKAGRYKTGCPKLAESLRFDRSPGTLFTLAVCESRASRTTTAIARFDEYLQLYDGLPPDEQTKQGERAGAAKQERDRLVREVPELTLRLAPGAPAAVVVKRDGELIEPAMLGVPLRVDPGDHVLSTQLPGGPLWEKRISIGKGEKQQVTLEVKAQVAPSKPTPVSAALPSSGDKGPGSRRVAVYVIGGVGLAGLVAGGVTGGLALAKKGDVDEHCGNAVGYADKTACDTTGVDAAQSMKTGASPARSASRWESPLPVRPRCCC